MSDIQKLIDQRANVVNQLQTLVSEATKGGKPADAQKFAEMTVDIEALGEQINQLQKTEAFAASLNETFNRPVVQKMTDGRKKERDYREVFFDWMRTGRREEFASHTVAASAGNNVAVPTPTAADIFAQLADANVVRQFATVQNYDSDVAIGVGGRTTAYYVGETGSYTEAATMGSATLGSYKVTALTRVSEEALRDTGFDIENYIITEFANGLAVVEEEAFLNGTSAVEPTGLLTLSTFGGTSLGSTTLDSTSSVSFDELNSIKYSMVPSYRRNAGFVLAGSSLSKVFGMVDTAGQPIFRPRENGSQYDTLLGLPVWESDSAPAWGSNKTIGGLICGPEIVVANRGPLYIQRLNEAFATTGEVGFRAFLRSDVKPRNAKAIHLIKVPA